MDTTQKSGFWDIGYSQLNVSCMGGPSVEINEIVPILKKGGFAIELGCGEARNTLYLGLLGMRVKATDLSPVAIDKVNYLASELAVNIETAVEDAESLVITDTIDLLIAQTVFHFVEKDNWKKKLLEAKEKTNEGGIHCFTNIIDLPEYPVPDEILSYGHKKSFNRGDLEKFYSDWEIIRSDFYVKWDSHPGIPMHCHAIEKFVVRKPVKKHDRASIEVRPLRSDVLLSEDLFQSIPLGITLDKLPLQIPETQVRNIMTIKQRSVGGNNQASMSDEYLLEDRIYKDKGLQFVNGTLTGKYRYFTTPVRIECKMNPE